jgi:hypothetical protein
MASAMNMDELEKEGNCDARGRCPLLKSQELEVVGSNAGSEEPRTLMLNEQHVFLPLRIKNRKNLHLLT